MGAISSKKTIYIAKKYIVVVFLFHFGSIFESWVPLSSWNVSVVVRNAFFPEIGVVVCCFCWFFLVFLLSCLKLFVSLRFIMFVV